MAFRPSVVIYKKFFPSSFPMCVYSVFLFMRRYPGDVHSGNMVAPYIHDKAIEFLHITLHSHHGLLSAVDPQALQRRSFAHIATYLPHLHTCSVRP